MFAQILYKIYKQPGDRSPMGGRFFAALRMTDTNRFVILNREAVKNLRPFLLRAGEDTRPYEKYGVPAKLASWGKGRMAVAADKFA